MRSYRSNMMPAALRTVRRPELSTCVWSSPLSRPGDAISSTSLSGSGLDTKTLTMSPRYPTYLYSRRLAVWDGLRGSTPERRSPADMGSTGLHLNAAESLSLTPSRSAWYMDTPLSTVMYPPSSNISSPPAALTCRKCPDVIRTWSSRALHLTLAISDPFMEVDSAPMTSPAPAWLVRAYSPGTMSWGRPHENSPRYGYSASEAMVAGPDSVSCDAPPSGNSVSTTLSPDGELQGSGSGSTPSMKPRRARPRLSPMGSTQTSTHDPGTGMYDCAAPYTLPSAGATTEQTTVSPPSTWTSQS